MKLNVCACVFLWMNKMTMGENNNKWQQQQKVFCNDIVLKENDSEIR